jgi:hypothetical protein
MSSEKQAAVSAARPIGGEYGDEDSYTRAKL